MRLSKRRLEEPGKHDDEPVHLTKDGLRHLEEKLTHLKRMLPALAEEVRRTAAYGDRSENDEYKTAKGTLRRTNWQILNIQDQIKRVAVINSGPNTSGKVELGSTVVLEAEGKDGSASSPRAGARKTFEILGSHETDPARGRISYGSPLGAALMRRSKGDTVTIETEKKSKTYRIIEIR